MQDEVERIAAGLNSEQRAVLSRCSADERLMGGFYGLAWTSPPLADPVGIHHPVFGPHYKLNPPGLAVRAHLLEGSSK